MVKGDIMHSLKEFLTKSAEIICCKAEKGKHLNGDEFLEYQHNLAEVWEDFNHGCEFMENYKDHCDGSLYIHHKDDELEMHKHEVGRKV